MAAPGEPHPTFDETLKVITLWVGIASLVVAVGGGKFLSATDQRTLDITVLVIVFTFGLASLLFGWARRRSWPHMRFLLRTMKKDVFWFFYRWVVQDVPLPYDAPWVQRWNLNYCHPTCKGPYVKTKVSHIVVDGEYKKLIVSPSPYPYECTGHVFKKVEGKEVQSDSKYQVEDVNIMDEYREKKPELCNYVNSLMESVNQKLAWKFTEGEFKPHATAPWSTDPCRTAVGCTGEMYENTVKRFRELFESSTELSTVISHHMDWLRDGKHSGTSRIVISPCGFFISKGGLSYTNLQYSLSILLVYKSSTNPLVYVYDHKSKTMVLERSYRIAKDQIQKVVTTLSLWACSPTGAIHTNVRVLKPGDSETRILKTHCLTLEESVEYCMLEKKPIKLASIHGTETPFDVSAK